MAESIPKKTPQAALQLSQQQQTEKKRQLMLQQKEEMKAMKQFYAEKNQEIDGDSAAAISHITGDKSAVENLGNKPSGSITYNRRALTSAPKTEAGDVAEKSAPTKESDSFYKVQDRGSKITNSGDKYIIDAYAPESEHNNLRVSVQGDKAVISGQRKHSGEMEQGNKKITTNNFQTFREEFKFDKPVSHEGMTRERVGDFIRFSIPKLEAVKSAEKASPEESV
jgi:HSP20 family molecular chaperone IbpA